MWLVLPALLLFGVSETSGLSDIIVKSICENENDTLRCDDPNETLDIVYANYGRTSTYTCFDPQQSVERTNCATNEDQALQMVLDVCQNRNSCNLLASNHVFGDTCPGTYKYLEVQYSCSENGDQDQRRIGRVKRSGKGKKSGKSKSKDKETSKSKGKGKYSGKSKGKESGKSKGKESGKSKGNHSGKSKGKYSGKSKGKESGKSKGKHSGESKGKHSGKSKGKQSSKTKDKDDCKPNPCKNGATCTDKYNGFTCTCPRGYRGTRCEINIDECKPNPCKNGATCTDKVNGYTCTCPRGYSGTRCEINIDDCKPNPCKNGARCTDKVNGYTCTCPRGYSGTRCEINIDDCKPNLCKNGARCTDKVNGYTCTCPRGYSGTRCEINIDDCRPNPCKNGATCTDKVNGYTCTCPRGYKGTRCETNIDDCKPNPCRNGATCTDKVNGYTCTCPRGYRGTRCEENIDDCSGRPCQNGGVCTDRVNDFSCRCAAGFEGKRCEINIDDCAGRPCQNGVCTDRVNDFSCKCAAGFTGKRCEINIDNCAGRPCQNGGVCTDRDNDFSCRCAAGFEGKRCEININDCAGRPCQNGGVCIDRDNGFSCRCAAGFEGKRCEINIDDCAGRPCQNGGVCTDRVDDFSCRCAAGFEGKRCEKNTDNCAGRPCQNGGVCIDRDNGFSCRCAAGFEGKRCEINIDDCAGRPCQNSGVCTDRVNDFSCRCAAGFEGKRCEINIDDCAGRPCQNGGVCTDRVNDFSCRCAAGFEGKRCEINIDNCAGRPCQNGGVCTDRVNDFSCRCAAGFEGKRCEIVTVVDPCSSNPCKNGATCENRGGNFVCQCRDGWAGPQCTEDSTETIYICENSRDTLSCKPGMKLNVIYANYGRTSTKHCVHSRLPSKRTNCPKKEAQALKKVRAACHDKNSCSLHASNGVFGDTCPGTWKYLEVHYMCTGTETDACSSNPCKNGATCEVRSSDYVCQCRFGWSGRHCTDRNVCECSASGDPHYKLFDGQMVHFQGVCTYKMAEAWRGTCGLIVHVKNIRSTRNPRVALTRTVYIFVGDDAIIIARNRILTINGIRHSVPYSTADYTIVKNGEYIVVENKCGMKAMFNGHARAKVIIDKEDGPGTTGICGDCNGVPDDYRLGNGTDVGDRWDKYSLIGNSYLVGGPDDVETECATEDVDIECSAEMEREVEKNEFCGFILDISGPFRECLSMVPATDAEMFYKFCAYDVCANWGNPTTQVCNALETFVDYCYDNGAGPITYRTTDFCPANCGDHMVYDPFIKDPQPSCKDRKPTAVTGLPPTQGCACLSGFVLDTAEDRCVDENKCGCSTPDNYYPPGGTFTNEDCTLKYQCVNTGTRSVLMKHSLPGCGVNAVCTPLDGDYACICKEGFLLIGGVCVEPKPPSTAPIVLTLPPPPPPPPTTTELPPPEPTTEPQAQPTTTEDLKPEPTTTEPPPPPSTTVEPPPPPPPTTEPPQPPPTTAEEPPVQTTTNEPPPPPPTFTAPPPDDACERLNPCFNGGSCTNRGQGRYECCCPPEFSGKHCEKQELDPKPPGPHKECLEDSDPKGTAYFGTQDTTTSGRICQPWGSTHPHKHGYHKMLESEGNYCRNRLHGRKGRYAPWCFTTDPDKTWEYCDNIPRCSNPTTFPEPPTHPGCYNRTDKGATYIGPVSYSASGKRCKKWHYHPDNNCRNPYGEKDKPWCHTRAGIEYCAIEICALPPPVAGENACSVDEFVSLCAATLVLTGDCYYRHKLDSKCDFTVFRRAGNVHDIYMPKVTKELQPAGSEGPHRHTDSECDVTFEVTGQDVLKIRYPVCGWCAKMSYESFMRNIADGSNSCPVV